MTFKALKSKKEFNFTAPNKALLERFPNPGVSKVKLVNTEFTSLCPITKQPDYATVTVTYFPTQWCLESKSFKLYCGGYRSYGTFAEKLTHLIATDVSEYLQCTVQVTVAFKSRGGITIDAYTTCDNTTKL